jgi:hypothetical protein
MKKILTVFAVALLAAGSLAAQVPGSAAASTRGNADTKVFAIEMGTGFAYDIGTKSAGATQQVSAVFGLTDAVQAGFVVIKGDNTTTHSFNLVKVSVYPVSDLSVALSFGANGSSAIASGFGVGYNIFRATNAGLTTVLQGNVGYLFNDIATGSLALGLNLKVGL